MSNNTSLYRRLLRYILPYKGRMAIAVCAMVCSAATQPMLAGMMEPLFDGSFIDKKRDYMLYVPLLIFLLFLIRGVADYVTSVASEMIAQKAIATLRQQLYATLHSMPMRHFIDEPSGYFISKISYDVNQVSRSLTHAWVILIRDSAVVIGLIVFLFYYSWLLTLSIVVIAPAVYYIVRKSATKMRVYASEQQKNMGNLTHALEEGIENSREVRLYGAQEEENIHFASVSKRVAINAIRLMRVTALHVPLVQILAAIAFVVVLYLAVTLNIQNSLSVGQFVSYITGMGLLFEPIRQLTKVNVDLQKGLAAAESIFTFMDRPQEKNSGTVVLKGCRGEINFQAVDFSFSTKQTLFSNFNLKINAKENLAIVGESGSGKSTLTNLIARFYEPDAGSILLDGVDIRKIQLTSLRQQISLVSQRVVLFSDTIKANVAYGDTKNASDEDVIQALKSASAWTFVSRLQNGIYEQIGDSGGKLSGGERHRILLARAFLKDAPLLILDEVTSSLDNQTAATIQKAIQQITKERTTITIAHRLSSVRDADRILVLDKGRIAEEGTHQSLTAAKGLYEKISKL